MSPTQFFRKDSVRIMVVPAIIVFWYIFVPLAVIGMLWISREEEMEDGVADTIDHALFGGGSSKH